MNTCNRCKAVYNELIQYTSCKKINKKLRRYDFGCAGTSEVGYRKLGADRKAVWKCTQCKNAPTGTDESTSLEKILREIRDIKHQLSSLPILVEDMKSIKKELSELRASCEFNSNKRDEYTQRLDIVERKLPEIDILSDAIKSAQDSVMQCKNSLAIKDPWSRLNNVEIKGVPTKKEENLFTIVESISKKIDYSFPKPNINYITRVPIHNSKEKSIIVSFTNQYVKEDFIAAARVVKNLQARATGFEDSVQRVFVNDHLTAESKTLLNKTKSVLKDKLDYRYVWVKYGKIHVRKNDSSNVHIINTVSDLNKLI